MVNIANESMVLVIDDPNVVATVVVTGLPSQKAAILSQGIYQDGVLITVSAITYPSAGATTPDPVSKIVGINSSAEKVKAEGLLVLLEEDETDEISASPLIPGSPPVAYNITFKVKIQSAGQTKVHGV